MNLRNKFTAGIEMESINIKVGLSLILESLKRRMIYSWIRQHSSVDAGYVKAQQHWLPGPKDNLANVTMVTQIVKWWDQCRDPNMKAKNIIYP